MKKDISANLYQKCLILCSDIVLGVVHNMSLSVLLPWQHTGFQSSLILKALLATFGILFSYLLCLICMIQQVYKYVRSNLWPCFKMFFKLKITKILKSGWRGLEKSELPWEPNFFIAVGVLPLKLLAYQVSMVSAVN